MKRLSSRSGSNSFARDQDAQRFPKTVKDLK
jgi:hypothetical protein